MAKNNPLLAETDPKHLQQVAIGTLLSFFVFIGSFLTAESTMQVVFEQESILFGTTYYASPPPDGYKREDIPTVKDAYDFGRLRGIVTTTDERGNRVQKICELADANCDGRITDAEWRAWATKNIGQMQDRCRVLSCTSCKGNNACWDRPAGTQLSYNGASIPSSGTNFLYTDMPQWYAFSPFKVSDSFSGRMNAYGYSFLNAFDVNNPALEIYYVSDWNSMDFSGGTVGGSGYDMSGGFGSDVDTQDAGIGDYNCLSATGCNR